MIIKIETIRNKVYYFELYIDSMHVVYRKMKTKDIQR